MIAPIKRILLVDDEEIFLASLERHLRREGFDATPARNGRQACQAIEAGQRDGRPFDLVVTDLIMPEMGGRALIQWIHAAHPGIPVILLTGFDDSHVDDVGIRHGQDAHAVKPITPASLMTLIDRIGRAGRANGANAVEPR